MSFRFRTILFTMGRLFFYYFYLFSYHSFFRHCLSLLSSSSSFCYFRLQDTINYSICEKDLCRWYVSHNPWFFQQNTFARVTSVECVYMHLCAYPLHQAFDTVRKLKQNQKFQKQTGQTTENFRESLFQKLMTLNDVFFFADLICKRRLKSIV